MGLQQWNEDTGQWEPVPAEDAETALRDLFRDPEAISSTPAPGPAITREAVGFWLGIGLGATLIGTLHVLWVMFT